MALRYKQKYKMLNNKYKHQYKLEPGMTGFLCTCNGKFREKECLRESYNILNEFADEMYGPEIAEQEGLKAADAGEQDNKLEDDIDSLLVKEVESLNEVKNKSIRRFQVVESGAKGVVFVKTNLQDPVKLAHTIVLKYSKGVQKSKFLLRLLPIEVTCKAYLDDIKKAADPILEKYFSNEAKTFAVIFNHRNNDRIKRDEIIENLAELVYQKNSLHKADLKQPQLVILVEVIRSVCCMSVVPDYYLLKKYNLVENALKGNEEIATQSNAVEGNKEIATEGGNET